MMQLQRYSLAWLLLGWIFFYGFMLGSRPLATPDEGRYAEIPREMVMSGDYVTPRLNGVKYFEKPPLMYWLQALSIRAWGIHEWGLRFWTAAFAVAGCVLTYIMGRFLFNPSTGLWGSLILSTSPLYFGIGHLIILDTPVTVLMNATLFFFLAQYKARRISHQKIFRWSAFACAALATLTKGLMACLLPGVLIMMWILTTPHKKRLKDLFCPWGWLIFLTISAPWHIAVSLQNPEFPWFYFIHEHGLRYLTNVHRRYQPFWFFIPLILAGFAPWVSLLGALCTPMRTWWRDEQQRLLVMWSVFIFLFFSCSGSKLVPYILPIFPALSLFTGHHIARMLDQGRGYGPLLRQTFWIRGLLAFFFISSLVYFFSQDTSFHTFKSISILCLCIGVWFLGFGLEWVWGYRQNKGLRALQALVATTALFLLLVHGMAEDIQKSSIKPLALKLKTMIQPHDKVFIYGCYAQDLPVYLERTVGIVDWVGELEFGTTVEDTHTWIMSSKDFWPLWHGPEKIYVFMRQTTYDSLARDPVWQDIKIAETEQYIVISNR